MINYFELSKCSFARKTINRIPKIKQGKRHKESSKKDAFALLCGMTKNVTFTQHTKINIFSIIMTNLCIKQQRVTVWWTKTNRQPHFSWAEEFVIDPEGNVIKVADGSCVQKKNTARIYQRNSDWNHRHQQTFSLQTHNSKRQCSQKVGEKKC